MPQRLLLHVRPWQLQMVRLLSVILSLAAEVQPVFPTHRQHAPHSSLQSSQEPELRLPAVACQPPERCNNQAAMRRYAHHERELQRHPCWKTRMWVQGDPADWQLRAWRRLPLLPQPR